MFALEYTIEIAMGLLGIISTLLGILVKRIQSKSDKLEHKMDKLEDELQHHRVEDARNYITRVEHDGKMEILKNDLREMIGSVGETVRRIENYIMENKMK